MIRAAIALAVLNALALAATGIVPVHGAFLWFLWILLGVNVNALLILAARAARN